MFDELAHIRESGAAMDREETNSASPVLLLRCLIFMGGCRRRVDFAFDITSETGGREKSLKPLRETAQAISNELGFTVRTTRARSHNPLDKCQNFNISLLDQSSKDALSGTLLF